MIALADRSDVKGERTRPKLTASHGVRNHSDQFIAGRLPLTGSVLSARRVTGTALLALLGMCFEASDGRKRDQRLSNNELVIRREAPDIDRRATRAAG
jgi:hypothetical protein